jgi:hypothetical protein
LGLINKYLLQMQIVLFEGGAPALLAPLLALALTPRRIEAADRYLLSASALLLVAYFAYWHDGDYLGPRFLLPLAPIAVVWTLRLPRIVGERTGKDAAATATAVALGIMLIVGGLVGTPARWRTYSEMFPQRRVDASALRSNPDLAEATILVPATWGSQVRARMWARGLPRRDTEWIYRRVDLCALDFAVSQLERRAITDPMTSARELMPLTADSIGLQATTLSPDTSQMMRVGARYPPPCAMRLHEERGEVSMLHFLPPRPGGPRFARDLHERNLLLLDTVHARVYQLRPENGGELGVHAIDLDSARYQWNTWLRAAAP